MVYNTLTYALLVWFIVLVTFFWAYFPLTMSIETLESTTIEQQQLRRSAADKREPTTPAILNNDQLFNKTVATTVNSPVLGKITSELVSLLKPATSDVRGNLGPASTVTNETVSDWLVDRWQGNSLLISTRAVRY